MASDFRSTLAAAAAVLSNKYLCTVYIDRIESCQSALQMDEEEPTNQPTIDRLVEPQSYLYISMFSI